MRIKLSKITSKGKALFLAYDHGMEHGPTDFNDKDVDPDYILDIAIKGKYNGIVFQKGIAEKYYKGKIPLILKLNGKTNLVKGEPLSTQLCSVKEALELGAKAIGYTIYVGSAHEAKMFREFEKIQKEAHNHGLPVIAWMYPRGKAIRQPRSKKITAYSARLGLELGADIAKLQAPNKIEHLSWAVKSAGKTKVVIAGGLKCTPKKLLEKTHKIMETGAIGLAIGRNVWQHKEPIKITKALKKIIFENKPVKQAMKELR